MATLGKDRNYCQDPLLCLNDSPSQLHPPLPLQLLHSALGGAGQCIVTDSLCAPLCNREPSDPKSRDHSILGLGGG